MLYTSLPHLLMQQLPERLVCYMSWFQIITVCLSWVENSYLPSKNTILQGKYPNSSPYRLFCSLLLELLSEGTSNTFLHLGLWLQVYFKAAPTQLELEHTVIFKKRLSLEGSTALARLATTPSYKGLYSLFIGWKTQWLLCTKPPETGWCTFSVKAPVVKRSIYTMVNNSYRREMSVVQPVRGTSYSCSRYRHH